MDDSLSTQTSLLLRLRDAQDAQAWQHFVRLYAPLILAYARKHRLQDADAADFTQEVLQEVSRAIGKFEYDPQRGSFRGWLFTLTHRALGHFLTRRKKHVQGSGNSDVLQALHAAPAPAEDIWEKQYQQHLFRWATEEVKSEFSETTWQAFWRTAVDGEPITDLAQELGLSTGAIYIARSRVQARLREKIQQFEKD